MSNTSYKIISLVIAIVLWVYVVTTLDPMKTETITDVPVQLLNAESLTARGLALSGEMNYTVDVVVKGKRGDLLKLSADDIVANADLYGFSIGKNYIPVMVQAPNDMTVIDVKNSKIVVSIEELVAVSKPIRVVFTGQMEKGIEASTINTQPEKVEVTGAKSEVDAVSYIKAEINTADLSTDEATIQTKAIAVNNVGDIVSNVRLSSTYIDVTAKLTNVKQVPLIVDITGQVAPIYEITELIIPEKIKIKGSKEALAGISELTAAPIDISQVSDSTKLPITIDLPKGVEFADGYEDLTVDIGIKPVATKEFTYSASEIGIEGMEGVTNISITTPQINIKISGSEAIIRGLQKQDINPYIDLDAASLISATAKVKVRYNKPLGHITVDPEEVHMTLIETE